MGGVGSKALHDETATTRSRGATLSTVLLWGHTHPLSNSCRSNHCSGERRPPTPIQEECRRVGENTSRRRRRREKIVARWLMGRGSVRPRWQNSSCLPCLSCRDDVGPSEATLSNWGSSDDVFLASLSSRSRYSSCIGVGGLLSPQLTGERQELLNGWVHPQSGIRVDGGHVSHSRDVRREAALGTYPPIQQLLLFSG